MREIFPMLPAGNAPFWVWLPLALLLLGLLIFFTWMLLGAGQVRFEVGSEGLQIQARMYGRRVPVRDLSLDGARPLDLTREPDWQLKVRTNGLGLPGYSAGWFRLQNKQKALVFLTDRRHVLYLPTTKGYALLLSVADPGAMLQALRLAAGM